MTITKIEQEIFKRIVKRWCANRLLVGTDFETAYKSWATGVSGNVDGVRVQRIIEDYVGKD